MMEFAGQVTTATLLFLIFVVLLLLLLSFSSLSRRLEESNATSLDAIRELRKMTRARVSTILRESATRKAGDMPEPPPTPPEVKEQAREKPYKAMADPDHPDRPFLA